MIYFKKHALRLITFSLALCIYTTAQAQETSASFAGGSIKVGNDTTACGASVEGNVRYNTTSDLLEYCDGAAWKESPTAQNSGYVLCQGVTSENDVGTLCDDGSIYAGFSHNSISGQHDFIYVTDEDQSTGTGLAWVDDPPGLGTQYISPDSQNNGQANHDNLDLVTYTLSDFPAFEICENLTRHGHSDWYLPSVDELFYLWQNRYLIGNFKGDAYWSSTETSDNGANRIWWQGATYTPGAIQTPSKTFLDHVRCIRRDS